MALEVKLSEHNDDPSKLTSVLDLPGDILIVPQACLGGKHKGKAFQYHNNINKVRGEELYVKFVELCRVKTSSKQMVKWTEKCKLVNGMYGIKQIYSTVTNGPFMHIIEF